MKKILVLMVIVLVGLFSCFSIEVVKAYEEGTFSGEQCIETTEWRTTAKNGYTFDQTTGTFVVSGMTANEVIESEEELDYNKRNIFYEVSTDGKTLTAYVMDYNSTISAEFTKKVVEDAGITTSSNCQYALKASKTSTGQGTTPNENNEQNSINNNSNVVEKTSAPNTASASSIIAVTAGIVMVAVAAYILLKKNNKLPFIKNN